MKTNHVHWGFTGPLESNFGDYAMFINNAAALKAKKISVFYYDQHMPENIATKYLNDSSLQSIHVKMKQQIDNKCPVPLDILADVDNYEEIVAAVQPLDILIVSGGGYLNQLWYRLWLQEKLTAIFAVIAIARQQGIPIHFMGNSYGPFGESDEFFRYQLLGLKDTMFAVRDNFASPATLQQIGISKNNISFVPDDLLFLDETLNSFEPSCKEARKTWGNYVVLEMYYPLEELDKYVSPIRDFVHQMKKTYGLRVIFLPLDTNNGGRKQGEYLAQKIPELLLYQYEEDYLPLEDAVFIIKNAKFVLCTRYHALVLALQNKTPVVNVVKRICGDNRYYYNKNYGILDYTLKNISFAHEEYLQNDFFAALNYVTENYLALCERQNSTYHSIEFRDNQTHLYKTRTRFLKKLKKAASASPSSIQVVWKKVKGVRYCIKDHGIRHTLACYLLRKNHTR